MTQQERYKKDCPIPHHSEHLTHPKYRADIDGLRAIAILSVVGFHAFPSWFKGGFIGVDVFFVISGFLISTIIVGSLERNSFNFVEFYSRRIRRIFPAMLLVLTACLAFGWFALLPDEYKQLGKHVAGGAGFVSNFVFWNESGYFDNSAETKPLLHLWSLGIEEQFYIFWPLLLWLTWKNKFSLLTIIIAVAAISFALNIVTVKFDLIAAFYSPQTRFWELLVGSVLAHVTLHKQHILPQKNKDRMDRWLCKIVYARASEANGKTLRNLLSIVGGVLIVIGIFIITKEKQFPGWWAILPTLGAALIISAGTQAWLNQAVLSHRVLVWFGLISFPLYLWHWPVLAFIRILEGEAASNAMRTAAVATSIFLAWLTYRLIERPVRFGGHSKTKTFLLIALMVVVGFAGYGCYKKDGFSFRLHQDENQLRQFEWNKFYNASAECKNKYIGDDYCNITNIDTPPDAAIIGDSHANHFYWGLSEYYKRKGKNLINLGASGCPPFIGIDMSGPNTAPNCYGRTKRLYDLILNSKGIKTVYIGFWHDAYFAENIVFIDKLGQIQGKNNYDYVLNALVRTINMLESNGKKVVLLYDMPDMKKDIMDCFLIRPIQSSNQCKLDTSTFVNDFVRYKSLVAEITRRTSVEVFDTHQYLEGNFPVDKNGIPTYRDYSHLSINGSMFFSDKYSY